MSFSEEVMQSKEGRGFRRPEELQYLMMGLNKMRMQERQGMKSPRNRKKSMECTIAPRSEKK